MGDHAAIYARVSTTDRQDYERQINELRALAIDQGFDDDKIIVFAETVSGYKTIKERPLLDRLNETIENDPTYFSRIYVTEISRIGRNPQHTRQIIDRWIELNVPLYIQSMGQCTISPDGKRNGILNIVLQVLMEYANIEAETFKTRSKSGMRNSVKNGRAGGGAYLPYGYKKDEKKMLVVDQEESDVVKEIFRLYLEGNGIKVISNILNDRNIQTRTNKSYKDKIIKFKIPKSSSSIRWSDKQIHDIIRNPLYKGQRRFKGELIDAPSIVSADVFDECNEILKSKKTRNLSTTYSYLLKDLIVCGQCGRNYFGRYKPEKGGDKVYKCSSTLYKGMSCGNCGINIDYIESVLYNEMVHSSLVLKYLDDKPKIKKELEGSIAKIKHQIGIDENKLLKKDQEYERLFAIYLNGSIPQKVFEDKQSEIQNSKRTLAEKIKVSRKDLKEQEITFKGLDRINADRTILMKAKESRSDLRVIFKQLIKKVYVNKIDDDSVMIAVLYKIEDIHFKTLAKYFLDLSCLRKRPIVFRYVGMVHMEHTPVYDGNRLISDISDIKEEFLQYKNRIIEGIIRKAPNYQQWELERNFLWETVDYDSVLRIGRDDT